MKNDAIVRLYESELDRIVAEVVNRVLLEGRKAKSTNEKGEKLYYLSFDGVVAKRPKYTRKEAIEWADRYIDRGCRNIRIVPV